MFRGTPSRSGVYAGPGVPAFTRVKWKFKTEGRIFSSPAIVDGVAFVGSTDGAMYAVDVETGTQKWKFQTDARITSSPAVSGGVVYFTSFDGKFYAVHAATGRAKWIFQTEGEQRFAAKNLHGYLPKTERIVDAFDIYLSSPTAWKDCVRSGLGWPIACHRRRGAEDVVDVPDGCIEAERCGLHESEWSDAAARRSG